MCTAVKIIKEIYIYIFWTASPLSRVQINTEKKEYAVTQGEVAMRQQWSTWEGH